MMTSSIRLVTNQQGMIIPQVVQGGEYLLKYDNPLEEAKKIIEHIPVNEANIIVISGLGFCYLINIVRELAHGNAKILILESDMELFHLAEENHLLDEIKNDNRVTLVYGDEKQRNHEIITFLSDNSLFVYRSLILNPYFYSKSKRVDYTNELFKEYNGIRKSLEFRTGNDPDDTILGLNHLMKNIPAIINTIGMERWNDKFNGIPAICVASGPSLEKNIHLLREAGDKAVIIAADSIVERLRIEGIVPHFITIVERTEPLYTRFFKNKVFNPKTILVAYSSIYPNIFEEYPNNFITFGRVGLPFERQISSILPSYEVEDLGQSCAHLSYRTAVRLGCDPIIFVGQDLSFGSESQSHAIGVNNQEEQEFVDKHTKSQGANIEVIGWYEDRVETTFIWNQFKEHFEKRIASSEQTVINATEGGAFIHGAQHIPLSCALSKYLTNIDVSPILDEMNSSKTVATFNNIEELSELIKVWIDQIEKMDGILNEMVEVYNALYQAVETGDEINFGMLVKKYSDSLSKFAMCNSIVAQVSQYPILKYIEKMSNLYITTDEDSVNWVHYVGDLTSQLVRYVDEIKIHLQNGIGRIDNYRNNAMK